MSGIRLSPTHGVNPSLMVCYFCGKDTGVALLGRLPDDKPAPHRAVFDHVPCDECKRHMAAGVILLEVTEALPVEGEPTRTGSMCVVRDEMIRRLCSDPELAASIIRKRVCFLPTAVWDMIGLPRGGA